MKKIVFLLLLLNFTSPFLSAFIYFFDAKKEIASVYLLQKCHNIPLLLKLGNKIAIAHTCIGENYAQALLHGQCWKCENNKDIAEFIGLSKYSSFEKNDIKITWYLLKESDIIRKPSVPKI